MLFQFQVAVSVSVVFLPGSVPADLPRRLPYGDVREERVPVSCKSPAVCPASPPRCAWEALRAAFGFSSRVCLFPRWQHDPMSHPASRRPIAAPRRGRRRRWEQPRCEVWE